MAGLRITPSLSRLSTTKILRAPLLRRSRRTGPWAGLFLLIRHCGSFTWATSTNSGTSLPAHSHTRTRQAMVSLPLVGDFMSFNEIVETLNRQGHNISYNQVPKESFAGSFPGATEIAETFSYWEAHTYLGSDSSDRIALANKIAGRQPTRFSKWTEVNFPA